MFMIEGESCDSALDKGGPSFRLLTYATGEALFILEPVVLLSTDLPNWRLQVILAAPTQVAIFTDGKLSRMSVADYAVK